MKSPEKCRTGFLAQNAESRLQSDVAASSLTDLLVNGSYFLTAATVHDGAAGKVLESGLALDWYFASLDGIDNNGVQDKA